MEGLSVDIVARGETVTFSYQLVNKLYTAVLLVWARQSLEKSC